MIHRIPLLFLCALLLGALNPVECGEYNLEVEYFRYLFTSIAHPDRAPDDLARREIVISERFGFNDQQAKALHAAGVEFAAALSQLRQSTQQILGKPGSLTDEDRAALNALANQRDQVVLRLATKLVGDIGPDAAARLKEPLQALQRRLQEHR